MSKPLQTRKLCTNSPTLTQFEYISESCDDFDEILVAVQEMTSDEEQFNYMTKVLFENGHS